MCTVTYISRNGQTIITSNRDELVQRPAIPPASYRLNKRLIFPKDPRAGGTWFAADEQGNVAVLLNGAFDKHVRAASYRRSRGLIVLDIISNEAPSLHWQQINLDDIEPFTLILFESKKLYQLTWDGRKHFTPLEADGSYIWASSTLYSDAVRNQRGQLFDAFLTQNPAASAEELLRFHNNSDPLDIENGLVIDRNGSLKTLTITQAVVAADSTLMVHDDLATRERSRTELHHLQNNPI